MTLYFLLPDSKEVGNANAYLDEVLAELRQVLYQTPGIDPKTLPDAYTEIPGGHAALYNGWLFGLVHIALILVSFFLIIIHEKVTVTYRRKKSLFHLSPAFIEAVMLLWITASVTSRLMAALDIQTCRYVVVLVF